MSNKTMPRSARRSRKPLREDWLKGPGRGFLLRCTYGKCSFEWQYFGRRKWAECPVCHSVMRVAAAKRNFIDCNKSNAGGRRESKHDKG
ncbi:MAG TPA: hypothetical protein VJ729_05580 [Nitrososphaeraceae archaeon]|nr:hypothetical protein [Nitrososphaeraceae archaeon]